MFTDNYSHGCKSCQKGKWLCIYLTYLCNANCPFCPAPMRDKDIINSSFGRNIQVILSYLNKFPFEGLSFSGGECFMVFDRMLNWLQFFKKEKPDIYYWAYTNGLDVKKSQMQDLKSAGLNELRFNIAACGYQDKKVLDTIAEAKNIFEHVAVEIPSIPEDYERFEAILPELESIGVDYLNLHEYILMPNDHNSLHAPKKDFVMNYEMKMQYHSESHENTERIKEFCNKKNMNIKINNCSLEKKEHQMLGRRITMGTLLREDHEKPTKDGFLETVYIPGKDEQGVLNKPLEYQHIDPSQMLHPDHYDSDEREAYLLRIIPKLSLKGIPKIHQMIRL